jgi:hypothetical protein
MDFGILAEGVVELDPMSGRMVIRIQELDGSNTFLDIQERMEKYKGEAVRFILTPQRTVDEISKLVDSGEIVGDVPTLKSTQN